MKYQAFGLSDVGKTRDHNEDSFLIDHGLGLAVVCDGMGGHAGGEIASEMTTKIVRNHIKEYFAIVQDFIEDDSKNNRDAVKELVMDAISKACHEVYQTSIKDQERTGMGTTVSMLLVCGDKAFVANVGDSRVYLFRKNKAHQLTEDHSLVNELVKQGIITKRQAKNHPKANVITRAVGIQDAVRADVLTLDLAVGDRFLLCSDGLHGYFSKKELWQMAHTTKSQNELTKDLIKESNTRGGKDNITSLVVDIHGSQDESDGEKSDLINKKIETLSHIPLFKNFNYQEMIKVLEIVKVKRFPTGQNIIREGDTGQVMYVILQGKATVTKEEFKINTLTDGAFFGEMSLIDRVPRSATVTADSSVKCLVIKRHDFFALLQKDARLSSKVFWSFTQTLNERLRMKEDELALLRTRPRTSKKKAA